MNHSIKRSVSKKANPKLWQTLKSRVLKGSKGGPANKWSARKAQLLVALYKKSGGKFIGKKSKSNSLAKWSREDWGYITKNKSRKGRYLPKVVREHLTSREKRIENRKKGSKRGKRISYSPSVSRKMRKYGIY